MTQLQKLLALCASDNDAEAVAALRAVQRAVEREGGRLEDLHFTKGDSGIVPFSELMDKLNAQTDQVMMDRNRELEAEVERLKKRIQKLKGENLRLRGHEVVGDAE